MPYSQYSVRDYLANFVHQLANDLPKFLGFLAILIIGYVIAKIVAAIIRRALQASQLNKHVHSGKGGNLIQRAIPDPTGLIAQISFWLLFLFAISVAASELGIPALVDIVHGIYAYVPNVIAAFIIFLVAGAVSAIISGLVLNTMGNTPTGKVVATAAPMVVMALAVFMILNQLKIAPAIVTITYAGLVGTATLAFGLGGKDAASKMFMGIYEASQKNKSTAVNDVRQGISNAKEKGQSVAERI